METLVNSSLNLAGHSPYHAAHAAAGKSKSNTVTLVSFDDEIVENWNISRNGNTPLYPRRSEINCFLIYIGELCDLTFCREWQWKDPTLSDADIQDHRIQASRFWRNIKCNCMVLNVSGSKFYFILISPLKVWPWLYICTHSLIEKSKKCYK